MSGTYVNGKKVCGLMIGPPVNVPLMVSVAAYDEGYAAGRAAERAAIVKWLRTVARGLWASYSTSGVTAQQHAADCIERGAHLEDDDG